MKKTKRYDDGGLSFADMSDEDRSAAARAAIADIDARQAAKAIEAGMPTAKTSVRRRSASKKVDAGRVTENLADMEAQGLDTGYSDTEARRNLARAGSRHAVGVLNTEDRGYSGSEARRNMSRAASGMKKGGAVSASKRADGCAVRGKTKGRIV